MSYYLTTKVSGTLDETFEKVSEALKTEGFGIVTDFDVSTAFKNKLGIDFRPYRILGACNPPFAKRTIELDDKIGVMLPCNLIIQQHEDGIEVSAIDPVAAMGAVNNAGISEIAKEIHVKLKNVIDSL